MKEKGIQYRSYFRFSLLIFSPVSNSLHDALRWCWAAANQPFHHEGSHWFTKLLCCQAIGMDVDVTNVCLTYYIFNLWWVDNNMTSSSVMEYLYLDYDVILKQFIRILQNNHTLHLLNYFCLLQENHVIRDSIPICLPSKAYVISTSSSPIFSHMTKMGQLIRSGFVFLSLWCIFSWSCWIEWGGKWHGDEDREWELNSLGWTKA